MSTTFMSTDTQSGTRQSPGLWLAVWAALMALFLVVAWQSPGFDDEMGNMELIEHFGTVATVKLMQTEDVHPPGGYLLNGLLHDALGRWEWVRMASAVFYLAALGSLLQFVRREHGERAAWLALSVAGLSPAALIWCTSLRWYAYFLPVFMWSLAVPRDRQSWWFHVKPAMAWLIMAHISYAALVLGPAMALWSRLHNPQPLVQHLRRAVPAWLVAVLLFIPQGLVFVTVHAHNSAGQTSGPLKSLVGVAVSLASNQGLFPLSAFGVLCAIAWGCLYVLLARAVWRRDSSSAAALTLLTAVACFVVSGLAGKFRNLVLLVPLQACMLALGHRLLKDSRAVLGLTGLATLCALAGVVNVVQHRDTTKNSWNLPVDAVITSIKGMTRDCSTSPAIYTFDPVLAHAVQVREPLWQLGNYYARFNKHPLSASDCTLVLHTYRGALSKADHEALLSAERSLGQVTVQEVSLGRDDNAQTKRRMDPDYPDSQVVIKLYRGTANPARLNAWVLGRR